MNKIDWGMEASKHITLETKMVVTIHLINIPSTNFHCHYEITHKYIMWWANLINEWIVSKNGIMTFNPNNIFTLTIKYWLYLAKVTMGVSNAIFREKVQTTYVW
jgi:hypothetical protein